jgi:type I restriction enzyme R subunit
LAKPGAGLAKIIAGYHQFHAVNRAIESTIRAAADAAGEDPADYGCRASPRSPGATDARA